MQDLTANRCCQVLGCDADLAAEGPYCVKRKCCSQHIRADFVQKDGAEGLHRFCFQCGRLEPIEYFDGGKRSCRARLQQRVKQVPKRRSTWTIGYNAGKKLAGQPVTGSHSCSSAGTEAEAAAAADAAAEPSWEPSMLSRSSQQKPKQRKKQQQKRQQRAQPMEEEPEAAADGCFDRMHELHELQHFSSSFGVTGEALAAAGPYEAAAAHSSMFQPATGIITRTQSDACVPMSTTQQLPVVAAAAAGPAAGGDVAWDDLLLQLCEAGSDKPGTDAEDAAATEDAAQLMALLDRELSAAAELARQSSMPAPSSSSSQNTSGSPAPAPAPAAPATPALQLMAESSPVTTTALLQLQLQLQQEQHARQQQLQSLQQLRLAKQAQLQLLHAPSRGGMPGQSSASPGLGSSTSLGAMPLELHQQQLAQAAQLMQQCQLMQQQQLLAGPMAAAACLPQQGHMLGAAAGVSAAAGPATLASLKTEDLEDRFATVQTLLVKAQMLMKDINSHCPALLPMC